MIKLGAQNKSTLKVGSQLNLTEQYKKQVIENSEARHTHENKEILDKITEEFLKSLGSSATIVNFEMNELEVKFGKQYSANGQADKSFQEVLEILENGGLVFGKKGSTIYQTTSYTTSRLGEGHIIFKGVADGEFFSEIDLREDLLDGYFVGELRWYISNTNTNKGDNVTYKEGDIIIDAPSGQGTFTVYRANNDFRSDSETPQISDNCEELFVTTASYAFQAGSCEHAQNADYTSDANIATYARYNMDYYDLVPQVTSTAIMDTLTYRFTHNTITHIDGGATTIEFAFNNGSYPDYYSSELTFSVGNTAPMLVYPEAPIINWIGTDCSLSEDNNSIFAPQPYTHYDILFYYNGTSIVGLVNGYKMASGNA